VRAKGGVGDTDMQTAREEAITDAELSDVVGHVAATVLTNYFNRAFDVDASSSLVTPGLRRSAIGAHSQTSSVRPSQHRQLAQPGHVLTGGDERDGLVPAAWAVVVEAQGRPEPRR
jgi:hypothetical protein